MINIGIKNTLEGQFKIERVDPETGEKELLADWFGNRIMNSGLNIIGYGMDPDYYFMVGDSNAAIVDTQEDLVSEVARSSTVQDTGTVTHSVSDPYYVERAKTIRFSAGAAEGALKEVGCGHWYGSGTPIVLFARALIVDGVGTPITLNIGPNDILDVTYKLRMYKAYCVAPYLTGNFDLVTDPGEVGETTDNITYEVRALLATSAGLPHGITYNSMEAYAYEGASFAAVTAGAPNSTNSAFGNRSLQPYVLDSYYVDCIFSWGLNVANWDINGFRFDMNEAGQYQAIIGTAIEKNNTQALTVTVRCSWARTTP